MKHFGIWLLVVLASLFLLVAGVVLTFAVMFPTQSWRYKTTVAVETPEGVKTGSAVREVSVRDNPKITPESIPSIEVKGEAVVVDLGKRGVLFALMRDFGGPDYAHMVVYRTIGGNLSPEGIRFLQDATGKRAVLEPKRYPVLAMFKDINDPKTVTPVLEFGPDGSVKADHFEELFGKGVKLKEISIEITDEKVTWQMKGYLPWLSNYYGMRFDGQRFGNIKTENRFANSLSAGAFSTGEN